MVDIAFKEISTPGCGERMLVFGEERFVADVEDTNS
jgi:hypothetical protein